MRLIDADKLTEKSDLVTSHIALVKNCKMEHKSSCAASTCEECFARTFKYYEHLAPTIEVEPVKHGEWIGCDYKKMEHGFIETILNEGIYCSNCHTGFKKRNLQIKNYCPNCGAKMDGGDKNETD